MFHKSNFGSYNSNVAKYADRDGYVPEKGDDWREMNYDLGPDQPRPDDTEEERAEKLEYLDEEWWPSHVRGAVEATEAAQESLSEWQNESPTM
jgi:hypothetical protein